MSTRQAEYNASLADIRADIAEFRAEFKADIDRVAAKSEIGLADIRTDFSDLKTEMAPREMRELLSVTGVIAPGFTLFGIFISGLSLG